MSAAGETKTRRAAPVDAAFPGVQGRESSGQHQRRDDRDYGNDITIFTSMMIGVCMTSATR
jgi:hypothetical protein